jgi:hypothetical protein
MRSALFLAAFLVSCGPSALREAQLQDTPEAYEAYLRQHPVAEQRDFLVERIDELRWLTAKERNDQEGFRAYLDRHPDGRHAEDARRREEESAWRAAREATAEAPLQAFLTAFPDGEHAALARDAIVALAFRDRLAVTRAVLDGRDGRFGVAVTVSNRGARGVTAVEAEVRLLSEVGKELLTAQPWLAGDIDSSELPVALAPGAEATFRWHPDVPPAEVVATVDVRIRALRLAPSASDGG